MVVLWLDDENGKFTQYVFNLDEPTVPIYTILKLIPALFLQNKFI